MGVGASRIPDKCVGLVQVNVIEDIYCLNPELQFRVFSKPEFLEKRSVSSPVIRPTQRVSLQVAKSSYRGFRKDSGIEEAISRPARLCIADYVGRLGPVSEIPLVS